MNGDLKAMAEATYEQVKQEPIDQLRVAHLWPVVTCGSCALTLREWEVAARIRMEALLAKNEWLRDKLQFIAEADLGQWESVVEIASESLQEGDER